MVTGAKKPSGSKIDAARLNISRFVKFSGKGDSDNLIPNESVLGFQLKPNNDIDVSDENDKLLSLSTTDSGNALNNSEPLLAYLRKGNFADSRWSCTFRCNCNANPTVSEPIIRSS